MSIPRANHGFTLIELLVVSTVGVLLLSGVVVAYNTFFRRQSTFASAQELISILQQAQSRARSGDKPSSSCASFQGYRVTGSNNSSSYTLQTLCNGSTTETVTYSLRSGEVFSGSFVLNFSPLPGPVSASDTTIRIIQSGTTGNPPAPRYEFVVTRQGVINEGTYVQSN